MTNAAVTTWVIWASQAERQISKHFGLAARKMFNLHKETLEGFWKNGASPETAADTIVEIHMAKARNTHYTAPNAESPTLCIGTIEI